jgi:hypothetical protein
MFGKIFDTTEVDVFAAWVAAELARAVSPQDCQARSKRADSAAGKLNDRVARRAAELVSTHHLNAYKKAKLGSRLLDMLEAKGYPADFRKQFAYDVVALVATADSHKG